MTPPIPFLLPPISWAILAAHWLQDGLKVLVGSLPRVEVIQQAETLVALLRDCPTPPDIVLVDGEVENGLTPAHLHTLKSRWPLTRYVVLVQDPQQGYEIRQGGAEVVVPKGIRAENLLALLQNVQGIAYQEQGHLYLPPSAPPDASRSSLPPTE